ncbi:hypothetical protein EYB53_007580 [Candidatus Chloroploca sp. M-50]|uniref:Uncharacterized protein n=1 Tax=Candidatus Chloroploca mongolica TaxID=2528176 RepID=A0ABS4D7Y6_9CHLR|nr:hypothetical protein [Candidatus Chloroploca mongolica]MBP1465563.1 hypothetical protein [Candidatus Chloroploca mongolica]
MVQLIKRTLVSLMLAFVVSLVGLVVMPVSARLAEPLLCQGRLEPETGFLSLRFRCILPTDGRIEPLATGLVMQYTVPIVSFGVAPLIWFALAGRAQRAEKARTTMQADLSHAIVAPAEILRVERQDAINHQMLFHAAELTLVLWVRPPNRRPYEARVAWVVNDANVYHLRAGTELTVRINPERPEHVYPDQPWARYAWWFQE